MLPLRLSVRRESRGEIGGRDDSRAWSYAESISPFVPLALQARRNGAEITIAVVPANTQRR